LLSTSLAQPTVAQVDTVVTRSENSAGTAKRRGVITDWKGSSLSLQSETRTRQIDNDRIVEIQTSWNSDYLLAKQLLDNGQTGAAAEKLRAAMASEMRPWAQTIIRSDLVRALCASDDYSAAIEEFAQIIAADPQTRFLYLIPLPWSGSLGNARVENLAQPLLSSTEPTLQLIGASWLIGGPERAKATQILQKLATDGDPGVAGLAAAQLWRMEIGSADETKVASWERRIMQMPNPLRAGPYYVLATAQARLKETQPAAVNWMRIPILFPQQDALSAASLYKCASLLHNDGQTDEARTLWTELLQDYPESMWAKQVDKNLLDTQNN
jgi:tetratricopeptide (TPR) repeat protein